MKYLLIILAIVLIMFLSFRPVSSIERFTDSVTDDFGISDFNIDNPKYDSFKEDGILFSPVIKAINHKKYLIGFGLYTREKNKTIFLDKLYIKNKEITINKKVTFDKKNRNIYESIITITEILDKELFSLSSNKEFYLRLKFTVNGKSRYIKIKIIRHTEKRIVFPT